MPWSFSFQLLPGETLLEDSTLRDKELVKPVYSVFLTDQRVIFRFNGFGSSLCKAYSYREISDVQTTTRLFVNYLRVFTRGKDELFNVNEAVHLCGRILEFKTKYSTDAATSPPSGAGRERAGLKRQELLDMLTALNNHGLLDEEELREKIRQLDTMNL